MCAQVKVRIWGSKRGLSLVVATQAEEPTQLKVRPGLMDPAPTLEHRPSPPPMTTAVPGLSPVCSAARFVTSPATVVEGTISGSLSPSMPEAETIFSDHWSVSRSMQALLVASEGSVYHFPVRRRTIKSLALRVL